MGAEIIDERLTEADGGRAKVIARPPGVRDVVYLGLAAAVCFLYVGYLASGQHRMTALGGWRWCQD